MSPEFTAAVERKYALTKIAAGDYLLPSNDRETIWRIYRYEDGIAQGLDVDLGVVWGLSKWIGRTGPTAVVDVENWDLWPMVSGSLATRADAIKEAMRL